MTGTDGASLNNTINDFSVPLSNFSMNTHKITNLLDPTSAQDAATKNYVDTRPAGSVSQLTNTTSSAILSNTGALTFNDAGTNYLGISDSAAGAVLTTAKGFSVLNGTSNTNLIQGGTSSASTVVSLVQPTLGSTTVLTPSVQLSTTNATDPVNTLGTPFGLFYHMNPASVADCYL